MVNLILKTLLLRDMRQRHGGAAVMHRGRAQQGGNGNATIGGVNVQLVPIPAGLATLRVALGAAVGRWWAIRQACRAKAGRSELLDTRPLACAAKQFSFIPLVLQEPHTDPKLAESWKSALDGMKNDGSFPRYSRNGCQKKMPSICRDLKW